MDFCFPFAIVLVKGGNSFQIQNDLLFTISELFKSTSMLIA